MPTVFCDTGGEFSSCKQAGQEVSVSVEKKRMVYEKRERFRAYHIRSIFRMTKFMKTICWAVLQKMFSKISGISLKGT